MVGNKADLEERRQVKKELAETLVEIDWEHGFIETSARSNVNILQVSYSEHTLMDILKKIYLFTLSLQLIC